MKHAPDSVWRGVQNAAVWALVLMSSAFLLSYALHGTRFFAIFGAFIAINVGYSYVFRNVRYFDFHRVFHFTDTAAAWCHAVARQWTSSPSSWRTFMVGAHFPRHVEYNLRDKAATLPPLCARGVHLFGHRTLHLVQPVGAVWGPIPCSALPWCSPTWSLRVAGTRPRWLALYYKEAR